MRYWLISILDWLDDTVLRHRLYTLGLCTWLAEHPWWQTRPPTGLRDGVPYHDYPWRRQSGTLAANILPDDETPDMLIEAVRQWRQEGQG